MKPRPIQHHATRSPAWCFSALTLLCVNLFLNTGCGADPETFAAWRDMKRAYATANEYERFAFQVFEVETPEGFENAYVSFSQVRFDRDARLLRVKQDPYPRRDLLIEGDRLRLRMDWDGEPEHVGILDRPIDWPVTANALFEATPFTLHTLGAPGMKMTLLRRLFPADVEALLGGDPAPSPASPSTRARLLTVDEIGTPEDVEAGFDRPIALHNADVSLRLPDPNEPQPTPVIPIAMRIEAGDRSYLLTIDPRTKLLSGFAVEAPASWFGLPAEQRMRLTTAIRPFPPEGKFEPFDTDAGVTVDTFDALIDAYRKSALRREMEED